MEQYRNKFETSSLVFIMSIVEYRLMTLDAFNAFCTALPHTSHVVQWGDSDVWKIDGKVFAVAGWNRKDTPGLSVSFKVSPIAFEILSEQPGLRPAPYLASRGMKWIQRYSDETMSDDDFQAYLVESHRLVGQGLSKKRQRELGLIE